MEAIFSWVPRWFLIAFGVVDILRGGFHFLAPDSGVSSVAGLNIKHANGQDLVFFLALIGIVQMSNGVWSIYFGLYYTSLIPFALATNVAKNVLTLFTEHSFKPPSRPVPGRFMHAATLILSSVMLLLCILKPNA